VGEATDGAETVALAERLKPDVIVIDLDMPDVSGAETLRRSIEVNPEVRMVVLSTSEDDPELLRAFEAGAHGYILKSAQAEEFVGGIRQTACGQAVLSLEILRSLVQRVGQDNHSVQSNPHAVSQTPELTARELDVLRLIVEGADNAAIGLELSISRHTVKQHVTNIFEKLEVSSRVEAAVYAVRAGL
ncbi:MAG TPA: response regulator transcription factor, partial [Solirubrobacteraceae bacterium]|nr:response regulator transcription factor [Solirubrobacteraceae bacterium]